MLRHPEQGWRIYWKFPADIDAVNYTYSALSAGNSIDSDDKSLACINNFYFRPKIFIIILGLYYKQVYICIEFIM